MPWLTAEFFAVQRCRSRTEAVRVCPQRRHPFRSGCGVVRV